MIEVSRTCRGVRFRLAFEPEAQLLENLLKLCRQKPARSTGVLKGRGGIVRAEVPGLGPVVVKHYLRGGLLRLFIRSIYFGRSSRRSDREYEILKQALSLGVNTPEPLASATEGAFFYRAWLITREIPSNRSLAEMARSGESLMPVFEEIARQIGILIEHNILHIDLHPGNVLVDADGKVYLLDFDKARIYTGSRNNLRDQYLIRWRRAVIKHNLPDELSEMFCLGLRKSNHGSSR